MVFCINNSCFSVPGKTQKSDRNSCSHQLCECDREFAMCLQKYLPCPTTKAMCKSKKRLWQNLLMGVGTGKGVHNPYKSHHGHHHDHDQSSERYILLDDIHGSVDTTTGALAKRTDRADELRKTSGNCTYYLLILGLTVLLVLNIYTCGFTKWFIGKCGVNTK